MMRLKKPEVNIGFTKRDKKRLALQGGVRRVASDIYPAVSTIGEQFLKKLLYETIVFTNNAQRKTVSVTDLRAALKQRGVRLYGY